MSKNKLDVNNFCIDDVFKMKNDFKLKESKKKKIKDKKAKPNDGIYVIKI